MKARKEFRAHLCLDRGAIEVLDALAAEYDDNRSFTLRLALREAAERRGITVNGKPPATQAEGVQDERVTA